MMWNARRRTLRTFALGSLLLGAACNLISGIGELEVREPSSATDGGDATSEGSSVMTDADVRSPDADAAVDAFVECPGFVLPIRTDFDESGLGADWTPVSPDGGSVVVANQRLELTNGGAVKATRAMDPQGGIRVFGRFKMASVPTDGGIRQSFAIYTRSDGTFAANHRPSGVACVLENVTPKIQLDGPTDAGSLGSGPPLFNQAVTDRLVDFNVFDDGNKVRCAFRVHLNGDLTQVEATSSWRPSGPSSVVLQSQAPANDAVEVVGIEHGIPREPTHHFEFEAFDPVNPFNSTTLDHIFIPGQQYNDFTGPLSRNQAIFGGYGLLSSPGTGFSLGGDFCCGPPFPRIQVVQFKMQPFTVAFWIKVDALPKLASFSDLLGNGGPDGGFDVRLLSNGVVRATLDSPTSSAAVETPAPVVSAAKWVHVAVRREGSRVDLLINGALSATTTGDAGIVDLANPRDLIAGFLAGTPDSAFDGGIDGIKTYDTALSTCQIRVLASPAAP